MRLFFLFINSLQLYLKIMYELWINRYRVYCPITTILFPHIYLVHLIVDIVFSVYEVFDMHLYRNRSVYLIRVFLYLLRILLKRLCCLLLEDMSNIGRYRRNVLCRARNVSLLFVYKKHTHIYIQYIYIFIPFWTSIRNHYILLCTIILYFVNNRE